MKRCYKCKEEKPREEFYRDISRGDGLEPRCKDCKRAYVRGRQDVLNAQARERYRADATLREAHLAACRARYQEKREQYLAVGRQRYRRNRESRLAAIAEYKRSDAGRLSVSRANARRRARQAGVLHIPMTPREIRRLYSQPCAHCGTTENLHRDHIIPIARGGPDTFGNSQMLCGSCNSSKGTRFNADARFRMRRLRRTA